MFKGIGVMTSMRSSKPVLHRLIAGILSMLSIAAYGGMIHRYSFSGNANDSIGNAHGVLVNNGADAYFTSTTLEMGNSELPNSSSSTINYVDLPNGIISSISPAVTLEAWVTWYGPSNSAWQRIFDIGISDAGENQSVNSANSGYFFLTPYSGGGTYRFGHRNGIELGTPVELTIDSAALPVNQQVHVAIVWDDVAGQVRMYYNGQRVASGPLLFTLSQLKDVNNWLGRSQWPDPAFNGSYNEFRIYDIALSDAMLLASYQAGPDAPIAAYAAPSNPQPYSGGISGGLTPVLTWQSDTSADITGHRVYLGTDYQSVLKATPESAGIFQGVRPAGCENYTPAAALMMDQTYFWRIEEVTVSGYVFSGPVWNFRTVNLKAHTPFPSNGVQGVGTEGVTLHWQSGAGAVGHQILWGTSPAALSTLEINYPLTSYSLPKLDFETVYYWRIDEIYPSETIIGDVWTFTTMEKPASCLGGDLDGDCQVNLQDAALFSSYWMSNIDCSAFDCPDWDQNRWVDTADLTVLADNWLDSRYPQVVINEIHYHPDSNKEPVEFVELYNASAMSVDLNGWRLDGAVKYTFRNVPVMHPGAYIVVSENPEAFQIKFGLPAYGPFEGKLSNEGERLVLRNPTGLIIDEVNYDSEFPWPIAAGGEGASMELIHPSLDNDLAGSWRSSGYNEAGRPELSYGSPTPGRRNSVYALNAPPQIRQVRHTPQQPRSTEPILITAKISDPDGVKRVYLNYQLVSPGSYIPAYLPIPISSLIADPYQPQPLNPEFENSWITVLMMDNGLFGDAVAGDNIYTCRLSPQSNRVLLRYRIEAWDQNDNSIRVPYADDPSLNFACFIYDGVPDYTTTHASVHPDGVGHSYSSDILTSIPVYTLITRAADLYQCNGYNAADRIDQGTTDVKTQDAGRVYNWEGAFVYEGKVYDHIGYRLRGGNGRYNYGLGGKRSMKFRFNRGNYFQAKDLYGNPFPSKWQHLNTGKMFGNKITEYRKYPYGLNEVMDMLLFNIAGVPAPETYWIHFRVVDGLEEAPAGTQGQYEGDFWGLYLAFENYDGAFLERLNLPKANLYKLSDKIYDGARQLRYQGENAVADSSDYENIRWNLNYQASADFIRRYLDCDEWYRYHTVTEAIRHYDIFSGSTCIHCLKNCAWYFYPNYSAENPYGQLQFLPFDVDDTWGPYFNYGCDHAKGAIYDQMYDGDHVLRQYTAKPEKAPIKQEYRNYIREFRDLLWQPEVINPLIAELASVIADFVPADRDRWRLVSNSIDNGPLEEGVALMEQFAWSAGTFDGKYYWSGTASNLDTLAGAEGDSTNIPNTPTITYIGTPGYPENDLRFRTSAFSGPQGNGTFAAMKWRIAEYENLGGPSTPTQINLINRGALWRYFKGTQEPSAQTGAWRQIGFDDSQWSEGTAPVGYDTNLVMGTSLNDMRGNYSTIYLRKAFTVADLEKIQSLQFAILRDDGFKLWINGQLALEENVPAQENLPYNTVLESYGLSYIPDETIYKSFEITNPQQYLTAGTNVIAIQVINVSLSGSSDCYADLEVIAKLSAPSEELKKGLSRHKYELQPVWESGELTTFNSDIQIPADGVKPGRTYRVRCKMKDTTGRWSHWSAPIEFVAGEPIGSEIRDYLRITEVMYNPAAANPALNELNVDNNEFEFIELKNCSVDKILDLSAVSFTSGVTFSFAGSAVTTLNPGQFVLVVKNAAAFDSRYPGLSSRIAGTYTGSLSNSGEVIKLEDTWNGTLAEFEYNDGRGWPIAADGTGHSLVPLPNAIVVGRPSSTLNYGGNWRQSAYIGGSPAADDPSLPAGLLINEFMAHTDFSDQNYPGYDSNDWIELYNAGNSMSLDGNWYLSDDGNNLKKWPLPVRSVLSGQFISFDEVTGFHSPLSTGFGLDKAGEQIFLSYLPGVPNADRIVDCIKFKGQENGFSYGRYPDAGPYWLAMQPSRNAPNIQPLPSIVISEIMYHPQNGTNQDEYIELYNPTDTAIELQTSAGPWALDGAVNFQFSPSIQLPAQTKIVIVGFDPAADAQRLNAFKAVYNNTDLVAGVNIFGPWTGDLSNAGERLTLEKPQDSDDPLVPTAISWIIVDECIYGDAWPWPAEPDGTGMALGRITITGSGNNPASWGEIEPSPGQ